MKGKNPPNTAKTSPGIRISTSSTGEIINKNIHVIIFSLTVNTEVESVLGFHGDLHND